MKIFRWLLCHLLTIILVVSAALVYLSRETLTNDLNRMLGKQQQSSSAPVVDPADESTADKKANISDARQHTQQGSTAKPSRTGVSPEMTPGSPAKPEDPWSRVIYADESTEKSAPAEQIVAKQKKAESTGDPRFPPDDYDPESSGSTGGTELNRETGPSRYPAGTASANAAQSVNLRERGSGADIAGYPAAESERAADYMDKLTEARRLYWEGKAGQAQASYEKLMFDYPNNPEAPAELGNLLMQQGNRKGAVWAYQSAIPRYLDLHREQEAINLVRSISQIDPAIAESLQKKYW
jgi:hypothetical protein